MSLWKTCPMLTSCCLLSSSDPEIEVRNGLLATTKIRPKSWQESTVVRRRRYSNDRPHSCPLQCSCRREPSDCVWGRVVANARGGGELLGAPRGARCFVKTSIMAAWLIGSPESSMLADARPAGRALLSSPTSSAPEWQWPPSSIFVLQPAGPPDVVWRLLAREGRLPPRAWRRLHRRRASWCARSANCRTAAQCGSREGGASWGVRPQAFRQPPLEKGHRPVLIPHCASHQRHWVSSRPCLRVLGPNTKGC